MTKRSFKDYNSRKDAEGSLQKYPFIYPGEEDQGDYLMVRSQYCSEFREAQLKANRQIAALVQAAGGPDKVDEELLTDIRYRAFATLVASWTFEEECNVDNVAEFLRNNDFVYDDINSLAAKDSLFFKKSANA